MTVKVMPQANRVSASSTLAFGRPPGMKPSALLELWQPTGAVGTKVGPSPVRQRPVLVGPGDLEAPHRREGADAPRARSLDVIFDQVTTPAAVRGEGMDVIHQRVAGLDVHKGTIAGFYLTADCLAPVCCPAAAAARAAGRAGPVQPRGAAFAASSTKLPSAPCFLIGAEAAGDFLPQCGWRGSRPDWSTSRGFGCGPGLGSTGRADT